MSGILLDTHILIWYANGDKKLNKAMQHRISSAINQNGAYLASISLWEICMLEKKQRIILEIPCPEWINQFLEMTHTKILELTPSIAKESCALPGTFHGDPADCIITATARITGLTLLTQDEKILAYASQGYVSCSNPSHY